jgi:hypothetical protein
MHGHSNGDNGNPGWLILSILMLRCSDFGDVHNEVLEAFLWQRAGAQLLDEIMLDILFPDLDVRGDHIPRQRGRVDGAGSVQRSMEVLQRTRLDLQWQSPSDKCMHVVQRSVSLAHGEGFRYALMSEVGSETHCLDYWKAFEKVLLLCKLRHTIVAQCKIGSNGST